MTGRNSDELAEQLRAAMERASVARDELIAAITAVSEVARVLEHESQKKSRTRGGPGSGAAPGVRLAIFYWAAFSHLLEFNGTKRTSLEEIGASMGSLSYDGNRTVTIAALRQTLENRRGIDHERDKSGIFLLANARSTMARFKTEIVGLSETISSQLK